MNKIQYDPNYLAKVPSYGSTNTSSSVSNKFMKNLKAFT